MEIDYSKFSQSHVVYTHSVTPEGAKRPEVIYVGCCPLRDLTNAPDARRNPTWMEITKATRGRVLVGVLSIHDDQQTAMQTAKEAALAYKAYANERHGVLTRPPHRSRVKCLNDGQTFDSAAKACSVYGIVPANMSRHLNGLPGHDSVKGMRFKRITDDIAVMPDNTQPDKTPPWTPEPFDYDAYYKDSEQ